MTDLTDWTCDYCGWQHPVAVMVSDHEETCEARAVQDVA